MLKKKFVLSEYRTENKRDAETINALNPLVNPFAIENNSLPIYIFSFVFYLHNKRIPEVIKHIDKIWIGVNVAPNIK